MNDLICDFCTVHFRINLLSSVKKPLEILLEFHLGWDWHSYTLVPNLFLNLPRPFSLIFLHQVLVYLFLDSFLDNCLGFIVCFKCNFCKLHFVIVAFVGTALSFFPTTVEFPLFIYYLLLVITAVMLKKKQTQKTKNSTQRYMVFF